jgi:hypothetical protein
MDGVVTATGMNTYFGKRTSRLTDRCCAILDRIIHNAYATVPLTFRPANGNHSPSAAQPATAYHQTIQNP